jgi:hypothetical protein
MQRFFGLTTRFLRFDAVPIPREKKRGSEHEKDQIFTIDLFSPHT